MGWDGMGWDGMGWDGMGWDGMGWDGMDDKKGIHMHLLEFIVSTFREVEVMKKGYVGKPKTKRRFGKLFCIRI
jgi:hypothetical protein